MANKISIVTPNFPTAHFPERGAFVETLARHWYEQGIALNVIAPASIPFLIRSLRGEKKERPRFTYNVVQPWYMTFSSRRLGSIDLEQINRKNFVNASIRADSYLQRPDVFYGKFLFSGAYSASILGGKYNIPAVGDLGESRSFSNLKGKDLEQAQQIVRKLDGIVCVSERLQDEVLYLGACPRKVLLAPNEPDSSRFRPLDREKCRAQLKLPLDAKIVAFTGHFIERKGPLRLLQAIESLDDNVFGVFLGSGKQLPVGKKVLHAGSVPNSELPIWLNAADVFALPTLAEGHCNAVNEAISCGLPVVTSDISDMRSQLKSYTVSFCNPLNPIEIADAIRFELRKIRSNSGTKRQLAEKVGYQGRSGRILDWMREEIL